MKSACATAKSPPCTAGFHCSTDHLPRSTGAFPFSTAGLPESTADLPPCTVRFRCCTEKFLQCTEGFPLCATAPRFCTIVRRRCTIVAPHSPAQPELWRRKGSSLLLSGPRWDEAAQGIEKLIGRIWCRSWARAALNRRRRAFGSRRLARLRLR